MNKEINQIKRVGIDARLMYQTGVGVYIQNLIRNIAKIGTSNIEFIIYARDEDIAKFRLQDTKLYKVSKIKFRSSNVSWHGLSEQIIFLYQLWKDHLDLMHFTYFSWPILYFRPFIATIHDTTLLSHATGKATTKARWWYWIKHSIFCFVFNQQVNRSLRIVVPSIAVKDEIAKIFPQSIKKIHVLYEAVDELFQNALPLPVVQLEGKKYFLYVGNCYPHKNVETLIDAFTKVQSKEKDVNLCLVSPNNPFSNKLEEKLKQSSISKSVSILHNIPVSELKWLYTNAIALIFPSFAEGFGLPVLEGASCGCPLILSDIPVFHEIIGDNAIYFSPKDADKLSNIMLNCLSDLRLPKSLISHRKYSFFEMTKKIVEMYK